MRMTLYRLATGACLLALFSSGPAARADILDDILSLATAARDRATEARNNAASARDRAIEARNNAATARDTAIQIRDTIQEGVLTLSGDVRDAIDEAIDDLQQGLAEEIEGRDAFVNGGEAEPFRQNVVGLIRDMQTLLNTLFDLSDLPTTRVDFSLQVTILEALPARSLYPMYRTFAVETRMFEPDGMPAAIQRAIADLEAIRIALDEPEMPEEGEYLDRELAVCTPILDELERIRQAMADLGKFSLATGLIGSILDAAGTTELHKTGAVGGWAGVSLKNNRLKKFGAIFQGLSKAIDGITSKVNVKIRHCMLIGIASEARDRDLQILANQELIMKHLKILPTNRP
ncbi:MAG: hypothetical protein IT450_20505 [Phycisphaerales bacterium]|nr:hypothetical protein [Phycisphaerales bacterium]